MRILWKNPQYKINSRKTYGFESYGFKHKVSELSDFLFISKKPARLIIKPYDLYASASLLFFWSCDFNHRNHRKPH